MCSATTIQKFPSNSLKCTVIPDEWHKIITNKKNGPDLPTISILSEIVYWYRPRVVTDTTTGLKKHVSKFFSDVWQTSYTHFQKKFNLSHETIRRSLVKLELLGFIKREFRTIYLRGQKYNNVLFIHFNSNSYRPNSLNTQGSDLALTQSTPNTIFFSQNFEVPYPQNEGDNNIDIKNNKKKNRSITSTFFEKNFKENSEKIESNRTVENFNNEVAFACKPQLNQENETVLLQVQQFFEKASASNTPKTSKETFLETEQTTLKTKKWFKKELREFYPLSEDDLDILTNTSGREFSLNFINQLLLRLADKYPDHVFYRKKSFINYMTKVLTYEMRQTTEVNNERFRFKRDNEESAKDKFLEEIEYSKETTKEAQFRRKIAAVFDKDLAYNLLLNSKFKIQKKSSKSRLNKSDKNILENILVAELPEGLKLTDVQKKILLEQGRAVYGDIEKLNLMTKASTENFNDCITDVLPKLSRSAYAEKLTEVSGLVKQAILSEEQELARECGNSVWGSVRLKLRSFYGQGIDKSWFAKLTVEEDQKNKKLTLKAPTEFIRDWIQQHYKHSIEEFCQKYDYRLQEIET